MRTQPTARSVAPQASREEFLKERIERAQRESVPISRHQLANLVAENYKISYSDAMKHVGVYCDDKSPAVPEYLSNEFSAPYQKVLALFCAIGTVVSVVVTVLKFHSEERNFWIGLAVALVFALSAGYFYTRGLVVEFTDETEVN